MPSEFNEQIMPSISSKEQLISPIETEIGESADISIWKKEAELRKSREETSTWDKMKLISRAWDYETALGYSVRKFSGNVVDDDEFEEDKEFTDNRNHYIDIALEFTDKYGGSPEDTDDLLNSKSLEHMIAKANMLEKKNKVMTAINSHLTQNEQLVGSVTRSIADYDTILTGGIGLIPKVNKLAMVMAGSVSRLAKTTTAIGATRPFVVDYLQETHREFSELTLEGLIGGVAEGLAVKLSSKELTQALSETKGVIPKKDTIEVLDTATKNNIDTFNNSTEEVINNIEKRKEPKGLTPEEAKRYSDITNQRNIAEEKKTLETTEEATIEPTKITEEDRIIGEIETTNARELDRLKNGKTSNQGTKYFRDIKEQLKNIVDTNKDVLKKDQEFMQHLTNKDYESALVRAKEIEDDIITGQELLKAQTKAQKEMEELSIPRPAEVDDIVDALDIVEEELIKKGTEVFSRDEFNIELTMFAKGKKSVEDFITHMRNTIQNSNFDAQMVSEAVADISKFVDESMEIVGKAVKMSPEQMLSFSNVLKSQLEEIVTTAKKTEDGFKVSAKDAFIKNIKRNKELLKKNVPHEVKVKIENLEKSLVEMEANIKVLANKIKLATKEGKPTKKLEIMKNKAISDINKAKTKLDGIYEKEGNRISAETEKSFGKGIPIKREGNKFRIGKYKIPLAFGAVALGSNAFAGDFASGNKSDSFDGYIQSALGLILIVGAIGAFKGSGIIGRISKKSFENTVDASGNAKRSFVLHKKIMTSIKEDGLLLRTQFTETYAPLAKYADRVKSTIPELKKYVDSVLFNGVRGNKNTAELTKSRYINTLMPEYIKMENDLFAKWRKANNISLGSTMLKKFEGDNYLYQFRVNVSLAQAGKVNLITGEGKEFAIEMANFAKKKIDSVLDDAEELGVEGVSKLRRVENYLTRKMASGFSSILKNVDEEGFNQLKELFKSMHKKALEKSRKSATEVSSRLQKVLDSFTDMEKVSSFISKNDEMLSNIAKESDELERAFDMFKQSKSIEEAQEAYKSFAKKIDDTFNENNIDKKITEYLENIKKDGYSNNVADIFSSHKYRISLDMDGFYNIQDLKVLDGTRDIDIKQVFELDNLELFDRYISGSAGRIGLKQAGYDVSQAKKLIDDVTDDDMKTLLNNSLNVLLGKPNIENMTSSSTKVMQLVNNVASGLLLITSPLMLLMEATLLSAKTAIRPSRGLAIANAIKNDLSKMGTDSFGMTEFSDMLGFGVGHKMGGAHLRGESFSALEVDAKGGFGVEQSKIFRDLIMNTKGVGISYWSSVIEKSNLISNAQLLMDIAHGKTTVSDLWMTKYGLDDEALGIARKYLKPNDNGYVKRFDFDKIPSVDKNRLHNILFDMNQYGAQRSTIGGTPQWGYATSIGSTFMKLMSYTVNSFSNLGVPLMKGISTGDFDAMLGASALFFGGYLAGYTKDQILNRKEKTQEEYMQYALMQMPMLAPFAMLGAFTSPTVPAGIKKAGDSIHNFGAMVTGMNY